MDFKECQSVIVNLQSQWSPPQKIQRKIRYLSKTIAYILSNGYSHEEAKSVHIELNNLIPCQ